MKLRHYESEGHARFITFCTHRRLPILTNDRFRAEVCSAINLIRQEFGFRLLAYVIMPEHVHIVMIPTEGSKIGRIVGEIKRLSTNPILNKLKTARSPILDQIRVTQNRSVKHALWMRRCYDHNCRSEESMWEKVRYCHNNPVTRGLVRSPENFKWSSACHYAGVADGPIDIDEYGSYQ